MAADLAAFSYCRDKLYPSYWIQLQIPQRESIIKSDLVNGKQGESVIIIAKVAPNTVITAK